VDKVSTLKEYMEDGSIIAIMNSVCNRYRRSIDLDQIDSIKTNTLWKCVETYDQKFGAKFTSYLYQQLSFACRNELKKKRREFSTENICQNTVDPKTQYGGSISEVIDGLPEDCADIIIQRFLYNMTMIEIASANGYSRETARRRVSKAIKVYKQKNQI
jgi:RNA polymerase sigma factor (sigma-70 family)